MSYYKDGSPACNTEGGSEEVVRMLGELYELGKRGSELMFWGKATDLMKLIDRQEEKARLERDDAG